MCTMKAVANRGVRMLSNGAQIFMAGLLIAGIMAVPLLNILTPLFATAFMVHMHKRIAGRTIADTAFTEAESSL